MRIRLMGRTGLKVSEICLGTMTFGGAAGGRGASGCDEKESLAILNAYLEAGGNFIDTADGYADGKSEEILGRGLKGRRDHARARHQGFLPRRCGSEPQRAFAQTYFENIEISLRRLQTDYIDLFQVHCFDAHTPLEETLAALDALVRQGKVRYIGCSNFAGWHSATTVHDRIYCIVPAEKSVGKRLANHTEDIRRPRRKFWINRGLRGWTRIKKHFIRAIRVIRITTLLHKRRKEGTVT